MKRLTTLLLFIAPSCFIFSGCASSRPRPIPADRIGYDYIVMGRLGFALGIVVEVDGEFIEDTGMGRRIGYSPILLVRSINGRTLKSPVEIWGCVPRDGGLSQKVGTKFHYRVYEWANWHCFDIANPPPEPSKSTQNIEVEKVGDTIRNQAFDTYAEILDDVPLATSGVPPPKPPMPNVLQSLIYAARALRELDGSALDLIQDKRLKEGLYIEISSLEREVLELSHLWFLANPLDSDPAKAEENRLKSIKAVEEIERSLEYTSSKLAKAEGDLSKDRIAMRIATVTAALADYRKELDVNKYPRKVPNQ